MGTTINYTDATASSAFSKSFRPTLLRPIPDMGSDGLVGEHTGVPFPGAHQLTPAGTEKQGLRPVNLVATINLHNAATLKLAEVAQICR
jgi:hypothetical protein